MTTSATPPAVRGLGGLHNWHSCLRPPRIGCGTRKFNGFQKEISCFAIDHQCTTTDPVPDCKPITSHPYWSWPRLLLKSSAQPLSLPSGGGSAGYQSSQAFYPVLSESKLLNPIESSST
ncbi:hypothetical protein EYB25_002991 [Talaromyces marneffei]|uniref:Uncharacterized protein n=1 Tax=Talaromyces marneffei (strain ATCC 18224 / CBS 334.59 / QM 7333) TaxID=441960 RepID=B6Q8F0_TALMQ|nr:hypothetical protein PMAA_068490 [Talaromyces marneffei ATCC 18224]KAE8554452.1 hypothetical protein EYB25_002991 [Talaromyces marneffei]